jgi:hypothetical protein
MRPATKWIAKARALNPTHIGKKVHRAAKPNTQFVNGPRAYFEHVE